MNIRDFKEEDWRYEPLNGFGGYRNKKNDGWLYVREFTDIKSRKRAYELDYNLLSEFRNECLPFGKYPEYVLQDFLNKKYNK